MQKIIEYLKEKYQPLAMIVYGSYADGTSGADSDFDCLIVSRSAPVRHDMQTVNGVPLDVFVYTPDELSEEIDPFELIQIDGGVIIMDTDGLAEGLMQESASTSSTRRQNPATICSPPSHGARRCSGAPTAAMRKDISAGTGCCATVWSYTAI